MTYINCVETSTEDKTLTPSSGVTMVLKNITNLFRFLDLFIVN